jgi:DNA-directed RNA polymerase sigma subunit (sigma70/sigma32)
VSKTTTRTRTQERTLTRERIATALHHADLTPEEEVVVRLRYGLTLAPEDRLEFRGQDNEELQIRLALMEKLILERLESEGATATDPSFLDELKKL